MVIRILKLLALLSCIAVPEARAWDCTFGYRTQVSVAATATYSEEVRIDLFSADFDAGYTFTSDGSDVRVFASDDITPVDHFVTGWDPVARSATLYIRPGTLPAASSTDFYVYYGDQDAASAEDVVAIFPASGVRLRSRVTTADPTDAASARAAFAASVVDVDDSVRTSINGLNNRALGGLNGDFGWCVSAVLEVTPSTAGVWEFRYGGDFGRGGHLYVKETELEQQWNDDLWWANNFANTGETLEGSITLSEGWHRYEALGFEGCCDGTVGFEARAPGGPWLDLSSTNFPLRGAQCLAPGITTTAQAPEACTAELNAAKELDIASDLLGSADPYALPGSVISYDLIISNPGQSIDDGTIALVDVLPPNVKLIVSGANAFELIDGAPPSELTFNWSGPASATDDVDFSTDGSFVGYAPVPDAQNADAAVTHIRFRPGGEMAAFDDANGTPEFTIRFQAIVE